MREYSTPAVVEIPASASLSDTVFERAEHHPEVVVLRRKTAPASARNKHGNRGTDRGTAWRDVTAREFQGLGKDVNADDAQRRKRASDRDREPSRSGADIDEDGIRTMQCFLQRRQLRTSNFERADNAGRSLPKAL